MHYAVIVVRLGPCMDYIVLFCVVFYMNNDVVAHDEAMLVWKSPLLHAANGQKRGEHLYGRDHRASHADVVKRTDARAHIVLFCRRL